MLFLVFWGLTIPFSVAAIPFYISTGSAHSRCYDWECLLSTHPPMIVRDRHFTWLGVNLSLSLFSFLSLCVSLFINEFEHLFPLLISLCISFGVGCDNSLCPFSTGFLAFLFGRTFSILNKQTYVLWYEIQILFSSLLLSFEFWSWWFCFSLDTFRFVVVELIYYALRLLCCFILSLGSPSPASRL